MAEVCKGLPGALDALAGRWRAEPASGARTAAQAPLALTLTLTLSLTRTLTRTLTPTRTRTRTRTRTLPLTLILPLTLTLTLLQAALVEWQPQLLAQLHRCLGGTAPLRPLVSIGSGVSVP